MISKNVEIKIGDLVQATEVYHRNYNHYKWSAYREFNIAEVVLVGPDSTITVRDIEDQTGHTMAFSFSMNYIKKL